MRFKQLTETFKNLFADDADRQRYANEVFSILQRSYEPIGGLKGGGFSSPQDMIDTIPFWKLAIKDGKVVAVAMYRDTSGRKRVAIGTDGSAEGKKQIANIVKSDYTQSRSWAEISGPSLAFTKSLMGDEFKNIVIDPNLVRKVYQANGEDISVLSDYEYERNINGHLITKVAVGTLGNTILPK